MSKILANNRKAYHDYQILDSVEAGIVLSGGEVKSVKNGGASLKEAYISIEEGEVWLWNCHITPWPFSNDLNVDPSRKRKLLLHRSQIDSIYGKVQEKGITLIPVKMYQLRGKVKVDIGMCKGLKKYDKRNRLKQRQLDKELRQDKRDYMV